MSNSKDFANKGLARNKRPIANIRYKVELREIKFASEEEESKFEKYKFKDLGYLCLQWTKTKADQKGQFLWNWYGFITVSDLKEKIGQKQYDKFCQGKREFIIQRRVDGRNVEV